MSKSFTTRTSLKTGGRTVNNNRPGAPESLPGGRGRSSDNNNTTQTNRVRAQAQSHSHSHRGRGADAGPFQFQSSHTPALRGRGAGPSVSSGRGSNSITNTSTRLQNSRMDDFRNSDASSSVQRPDPDSDRQSGDQQGQYVGGYTKFEPNTKKRQQVSEMARKETEEYERYKQQNALKHCNYVGTTGGGAMTEEMVRRKQANDVRNQKFNRLQNQEKRKEDRREAEQREIDLKRAEARRKADENAQYRFAKPEDVRRKREQFLRQLESQSKAPTAVSIARTQSSNSSSMSSSAPKPSMLKATQQVPADPPSTRNQDYNRKTNAPDSTSYEESNYYNDDNKKFDVVDFPDDVMTLAAMFPEMDMNYLNGLYKDTGSVDAVLDIIGV